MLEDAIAAMQAVLEPLNDDDVPEQPPDQIGSYPALILYPQPGTLTFVAQSGDGGRPLFGGDHVIVVEWHMMNPDVSECVRLTTPMADGIPAAIFKAFHVDRLAGTVTLLNAIRTDHYGELRWGTDKTFGVRFMVDVTIYDEVPA